MKLTHTLLTRQGSKLFLQGVIHHAPRGFWDKVESDIIRTFNEGGLIFLEGITGDQNLRPGATKAERKIHSVLEFLESDKNYTKRLEDSGLYYQHEIEGPKERVISADCSYADYVFRLYQTNFHKALFPRLFSVLNSIGIPQKTLKEDQCEPIEGGREYVEEVFNDSFIQRLIHQLCFGSFSKVIIDWRNEIAVAIIDSHMPPTKCQTAYCRYGDGHIIGMTEELIKRGWFVSFKGETDLSQYFKT